MSVSEDLLCAFELLKVRPPVLAFRATTDARFIAQPLDGAQLKKEMAKNRRRNG